MADLKLMDLLDKIGVTGAQFGNNATVKSLEEIQTAVVREGFYVLRTQHGKDPMRPIEGYKGPILHIFTPEGSLAVALDGYSAPNPLKSENFGTLARKPDGYKDGFRMPIPDMGHAKTFTPSSPIAHVGGLDRKPRY